MRPNSSLRLLMERIDGHDINHHGEGCHASTGEGVAVRCAAPVGSRMSMLSVDVRVTRVVGVRQLPVLLQRIGCMGGVQKDWLAV
jgi:hypothetical protein